LTPSRRAITQHFFPCAITTIVVNGRAVVQKFSIVAPPKEQHHFSAEHRAERSAALPGSARIRSQCDATRPNSRTAKAMTTGAHFITARNSIASPGALDLFALARL